MKIKLNVFLAYGFIGLLFSSSLSYSSEADITQTSSLNTFLNNNKVVFIGLNSMRDMVIYDQKVLRTLSLPTVKLEVNLSNDKKSTILTPSLVLRNLPLETRIINPVTPPVTSELSKKSSSVQAKELNIITNILGDGRLNGVPSANASAWEFLAVLTKVYWDPDNKYSLSGYGRFLRQMIVEIKSLSTCDEAKLRQLANGANRSYRVELFKRKGETLEAETLKKPRLYK